MAHIKPSAFIDDIRGKFGTAFITRGHSGLILNPMTVQKDASNSKQVTIRNYLSYYSALWSTLIDSKRQQWEESAKSAKSANIFNVHYTKCGFNFYVACNINNKIYGDAVDMAVPIPIIRPSAILINAFVANSSMQIISCTLCNNLPTNTTLTIFLTPEYSPGQQVPKNTFIIIQRQDAPYAAQVISLATNYFYAFGALTAGKKIALYAYLSNVHALKHVQNFLVQSVLTTIVS